MFGFFKDTDRWFLVATSDFGFFGFLGIGLFDEAKILATTSFALYSSMKGQMLSLETYVFGVKRFNKCIENQLLSNITNPLYSNT